MNQGDISSRQKIIFATIACIEKQGIQSVTIRSIAKEAGVNSAAINYYFGSKEKLLDVVLESTLNEGFEQNLKDIEELKNKDPLKAFELFLDTTLEGSLNYPGIMKAHLQSAFNDNDYDNQFIKRFTVFLKDLQNIVKPVIPKEKQRDLKLVIIQIISAIIFPGLLPGFFQDFADIDLRDPKKRKRYVRHLIRHFFPSSSDGN